MRVRLLLLLTICLTGAQLAGVDGIRSAYAAEAADTESADEDRGNPDTDVFTPSEDISEDLAVPFPVDI